MKGDEAEAEQPRKIVSKDWRGIASRIRKQIAQDKLSIVAAGVAFFLLVGIFPALAGMISIYGLMADSSTIQGQLTSLSSSLPEQAHELLSSQLQRIAEQSTAAGWGAVLGILLALWSGSKAMKAIIQGLEIAYDEPDGRGFLKLNLVAVALTLVAVAGGIVAVGLIVVVPPILANVGLGEIAGTVLSLSRWPILILLAFTALAVLYRYGPDREKPRWQWVSWGSAVATTLWIVGSILFSLYVSYFGNFNKTYGSIGAVIILMMWFYLTAFAILLGAEINAELERRTVKDTTESSSGRLDRRRANAPDSVPDRR